MAMDRGTNQGNRERGNSVAATNGHSSASSNDGSISTNGPKPDSSLASNTSSKTDVSVATSKVQETRREPTGNMNPETGEYGIGCSNTSPQPRQCVLSETHGSDAQSSDCKAENKTRAPVLEPPYTKTSLKELDVTSIVHNPKLRHDINFDPDLHFRPNLDGERGRRKKEKSEGFWSTMKSQLQDYLLNRDKFEKEIGDAEWCLPVTLDAIRGILETLVPSRDRASVEESFDVELLMQQFRNGVADLEKLANWLSQLLKCHCAPMRDSQVDRMVVQLSNGYRNGDIEVLVGGMRDLLAVLEAMKLDVANHQIRCLRPLLISDTVHFEQKFFMKKIELGRIDINGAHAWFKRGSQLSEERASDLTLHSKNDTWSFMRTLVNLMLPRCTEQIPHTFLFDEDRLHKLRSDIQDLIHLDICMHLYRELTADCKTQDTRYISNDISPLTSIASSPCNRPTSPFDEKPLSSPTLPSEQHFSRCQQSFLAQDRGQQVRNSNLDNGSPVSSASSSSNSSYSSTPTSYPSTPRYLLPPLSDPIVKVRSSLQAILSSDPTPNKWHNLSSSLALQILRSTSTPLLHLSQFESRVEFHLFNLESEIYREAEGRILAALYPVLQELVETYTPLTSLQIFEAAVAPKPAMGIPIVKNATKDELKDIATRTAHIGILHWRVWAPLAYLVDPEAEDDSSAVSSGA